ncbi:MAG: transporter substrate-binding domain-containing protein [Spirochaetales bacterium]|nr:transporter substrate-binding domain-containing protein [Spirochaetales bacterium]
MKTVLAALLVLLAIGSHPPAAQQTFTISTSYQNFLSNAEGTGMLDLVLVEAFRRIGVRAQIVYTPTGQSLHDVNAGILDAEINRIAGMEAQFPNLRRLDEPNMTMDFVAFSSRPIGIGGWESIRDLDIGLVRGWKILEENTADFPHVTRLPTERELFTMLAKGRIDVALYDKLTGYAVIKDLGYDQLYHLEPPLERRDMYLYVNKKHEALVEKLSVSLRAMKQDGSYGRIVDAVLAEYGIALR